MAAAGLTTVDLFCGAGGITEGFRQAGFVCLFATDANDHAIASFSANHPEVWAVGSQIEDIDPVGVRLKLGLSRGELDCLVGGPPCQGFSVNAPGRFVHDPRNTLFRHFLRFLDEFQPKTFLLENVPGMLTLAGGALSREIMSELAAHGYDASQRVLFAGHYGVPQQRWRLIILGSRVGFAPVHPVPTHYATGSNNVAGGRTMTFRLSERDAAGLLPPVTVFEALDDLPRLCAGHGAEEMPYDRSAHSSYAALLREMSCSVQNHFAPNIAPINLERLQYIRPGGSWRDIPFYLLPQGMKRAKTSDHTRRYGRLHPDGLSGTVMTKMDPHWGAAFHYSQDRTLTVREAARLQSFPDRYVFAGPRIAQYKQVGNAVPVLMAKAIACSIRESVEKAANYYDAASGAAIQHH